MTQIRNWRVEVFVCIVLSLSCVGQEKQDLPAIQEVVIDHGITLHYVERGSGVPVVFVHGSLSDGGYWNDQLSAFAEKGYRAIAYSRRYNPPNINKAQPGYSAAVDAEDLAALIVTLHLGRVHIIGHSYGALTALFLAARHPELIRTMVLAEAPAVPLLMHLPGERAAIGKTTFADIQERMVKPMKIAFQKNDKEAGLRTFIDYVLDDPHAWDKMPDVARQNMLNHAHEWEVMMTTGELFPTIDPEIIRKIKTPVLLLSGEKSYRFLGLIDEELALLLPHNQRIVLRGASHRMWYEQPDACRNDVLGFWQELGDHKHSVTSSSAAHVHGVSGVRRLMNSKTQGHASACTDFANY